MLPETGQEASTYRLSPQQAFLLGGPHALRASQCVVVLGGLDDAAVRTRLEDAVARNESLRTTFVTPAGARAPVAQSVAERGELAWETETTDLDLVADDAALAELLGREADRLDPAGATLRALTVTLPGGARVLVLSAPAACADSNSLLIVARQVQAVAPNGKPALDPIQHADYAEWRHDLATGEDPDATAGRTMWQRALEDIEAQTLFGARNGNDADASARVGELAVDLDPAELEALRRRASEAKLSAEAFLAAAWVALLARLSGSTELLVAELVDGRSQPDLEDAIGPYSQPVPIRVSVDGEALFVEILDRVARARSEATRWGDYGTEGDLARLAATALAGFAGVNARVDDDVRLASSDATGCAVELVWSDGRLAVRWDERVYDADDASELARAFGLLLGAAVADPSRAIGTLPLIDEDGRARVLALSTGDDPTTAQTECIHHLFEEQVTRTPEAPAVAGQGETLTFRELNERANRLAHQLLELGVSRDQPVGLCMRRSPAMLVSVLAILKAGGGYVPLNFAHPPARLAHQLAETGAGVLLTEADLLDKLPALATGTVLCVDRDADQIAAQRAEDPPHSASVDDLAYVMYTSGSTGLPKGVAVTHRNLANYTNAISARIEAQEGWHFGVVSEISTDLGNTAIFPPLATGGCIHLLSPEASMDGAALAAYARENPIDVVKITPTHLRALLAAGDEFLPRRWLILGGEALSWELAERIRAGKSGCRILNHYGPTETTVGCCTFNVPDVPVRRSVTVPIGRPLDGLRAYVLDAARQPLPLGVVGELCVGGVGVARGYVNRPEETAARFVPDPQGGRMYLTGDRARMHGDGAIEFLGRVDNQLKIRGYRVEPGEIEAALLRHPSVREAAVVPHTDGDADPRLVAYFVADPEPPLDELQAFLTDSLPEYMVPSRWVPISSFPLTPSGKIDRQALPDPDGVQAQRRDEFVAPRDDLEREIAGIWSALLGVEEVGIHDDFFALGGHSLLATQAIMRVRRMYGDIPLGALFNSPTVAALADVVRERTGRE